MGSGTSGAVVTSLAPRAKIARGNLIPYKACPFPYS